MRLVLDEPIPSARRRLRPDFRASLEHIVMRALERDPARRYQTARELRDRSAWPGSPRPACRTTSARIADYLRGIFGAEQARSTTPTSSPATSATTTTSWCSRRRCRSSPATRRRSRSIPRTPTRTPPVARGVRRHPPDGEVRRLDPRRRRRCRRGPAEADPDAGRASSPSRRPVRLRADETPQARRLAAARGRRRRSGGCVVLYFLFGRVKLCYTFRPDAPSRPWPIKLSPFEVFPGRELKVGHPIVARLVGRKFDQLLEQLALRQALRRALRQGDGQDALLRGDHARRIVRLRRAHRAVALRRWPTAATRAACCRASPARRRASCRCCSARSPPSRRASTSSRRTTTALEYFRWRQEEANVTVDRSLLHARAVAVGRRRRRAVPRILDGLGPDEKVELLAPERARLRHRADVAAPRRRRCASSRSTPTATRRAG